jgi:hypothetical protein
MYSVQGIFQHHFQYKKVRTILDKIWYLQNVLHDLTLSKILKHNPSQTKSNKIGLCLTPILISLHLPRYFCYFATNISSIIKLLLFWTTSLSFK